MEFPKIMGTFVGMPMIRTIVFGVYIGVPYFGKLPSTHPCKTACKVCKASGSIKSHRVARHTGAHETPLQIAVQCASHTSRLRGQALGCRAASVNHIPIPRDPKHTSNGNLNGQENGK